MAKSKIRAHGDVPANWQWRDGRPRWVPSPTLRKGGWKGHDLKDGKGEWLSRGASIDAAERINKAVAGWRGGELIAADFAAFAPAGASQDPRAPTIKALDRRAIGRLIDEYAGVPGANKGEWKTPPSNEFGELKAKTQADYRNKLKRLVDTLAGYAVLPAREASAKEQAAYAAAVAAARAWPIDVLLTPEAEEDGDPLLYTAYWLLKDKVSLTMANGVLACASAWLDWCRKRRRVIRTNPAQDVDRTSAPGRLKPASWDALTALIKAAEELGHPSIADSIILGVDLSWSQADRLALTWGQIVDDRVRTRRIKTNRPGETRLLQGLGADRVPKIRARQKAALGGDALYTHVLICETTKAPWLESHYRHTFAEVRALAATRCPEAADVLDKDLRSTAVSVAYDAGLDPVEIAGRTLHSLRQIQEILDNHYGVVSREVGDRAAGKLDAFLAKKGIAL